MPATAAPSSAASATTHRLNKLNLLNYAAPTHTTHLTPPASPVENRASPLAPTTITTSLSSTKSLHALLGGADTRGATTTKGEATFEVKPTFIGGQPVSYVLAPEQTRGRSPSPPPSYAHAQTDARFPGAVKEGLNSHDNGNGHLNGYGNAHANEGRWSSPTRPKQKPKPFGTLSGISAIALQWPWGVGMGMRHGGGWVELGPEEAEVVADFAGGMEGDGGGEVGKEEDTEGESEGEQVNEKRGVEVRRGVRRVYSPPPQPRVFGNGGGAGEGELEKDSVYKAFVKQWCFAQSPPPPHAHVLGGAGSGGLVVG
jgi:hypothetical protein